ncbi:MAG: methyltransferase domain-containing protein [Patescibacteria group bacterium]|nr:methyltransferase domain-containing protein [Patescibacteria group bacterium]
MVKVRAVTAAVARKTCRVCKSAFTDNGRVKVFEAPQRINCFPATKEELDATPVVPLEPVVCTECGVVQLRHTTDADSLFMKFWYRSGVTATMREELKNVALNAAMRAGLLDRSGSVLDIGCNDGTLLNSYHRRDRKFGYEPALNIACPDNIAVTRDYYGMKSGPTPGGPFDVITAVAMFYDVDDPVAFCRAVHRDLADDGVFVVQVNYLPSMMATNAVDNVSHEHLTYFSLRSLAAVLAQAGLYVIEAELRTINGGSLRVYASKKERAEQVNSAWGAVLANGDNVMDVLLYSESADCMSTVSQMMAMAVRAKKVRESVRKYLDDVKGGLALCGASTRGNTLLQFLGLGPEIIRCAGERDSAKHGRMTATGIRIVSEEEARRVSMCMLVLPWHFRDEIVKREYNYMCGGGTLLFPLPNPEEVYVVDGKVKSTRVGHARK